MAATALQDAIYNAHNFFADKYSLVDTTDGNTIYYGFPEIDADGDDPKCGIAQMTISGTETIIKWAFGTTKAIALWSEKANLNYYFLKSTI